MLFSLNSLELPFKVFECRDHSVGFNTSDTEMLNLFGMRGFLEDAGLVLLSNLTLGLVVLPIRQFRLDHYVPRLFNKMRDIQDRRLNK